MNDGVNFHISGWHIGTDLFYHCCLETDPIIQYQIPLHFDFTMKIGFHISDSGINLLKYKYIYIFSVNSSSLPFNSCFVYQG